MRLAKMAYILTPCHSPNVFRCMTNDGKAVQLLGIVSSTLTRGWSYMVIVNPLSQFTDYLTRFSCSANVRIDLRVLINSSMVLLGCSLKSVLRALQPVHPRCIDTGILFHHMRSRPLQPGLTQFTRERLGHNLQDHRCGGHNPEEDSCVCIDLLKADIKKWPRFGRFCVDHEWIIAHIVQSRVK
ncbi:hypothetical protein EDB87DRAFT_385114 [Lactarius vividus]|nr:hypothetical protein EDB87DRAFT_385114 [Lactarius vividus]